ncbi:cytochrome c oxidase assembly factor COX20 lethal (3) 87Df [Brevipalpus obovatus]|uniref:cytochrome c oxidase assembly factor COX20 lethal (3) 87Df n=1 Tax=Brevipalpus obovatus TaxID=246614 RepID=UPI003D9E60CD
MTTNPEDDDDIGERLWTPKDFVEDPCFRSSLLYTLTSGIMVGTLRFMVTSNVPASNQAAILTMIGVLPLTWFSCKYKIHKDRLKIASVKDEMLKKSLLYGPAAAPEEPKKS